MNIQDCFDKKLLVKIPIDIEKSKKSVQTSTSKLKEAEDLAKEGFFNATIVSAYMSMFHIARALLYKEGIQEKGHYAIFVYLNEKYSNKIPKALLNSFDIYRDERHQALYGFNYDAKKEDAESIISDAKLFIKIIKEILL